MEYFIIELVFSLISGILFTFLIFLYGKHRRPVVLITYFTMLFLLIWAGGIWLRPAGPLLWGVSFINFLIVGLVATLLILAFSPPPEDGAVLRKESANAGRGESLRRKRAIPARSLLAGIIGVILIAIIVIGYSLPR
jgi:hypothetical protein